MDSHIQELSGLTDQPAKPAGNARSELAAAPHLEVFPSKAIYDWVALRMIGWPFIFRG